VHFKTHTSFAGKEFWCFSLHFLSSEAESLLLVITDFEANDMTSSNLSECPKIIMLPFIITGYMESEHVWCKLRA